MNRALLIPVTKEIKTAGAASVHHRFTYERFDALQNQVAGDVAWQILAELCDQLGVALVLLS